MKLEPCPFCGSLVRLDINVYNARKADIKCENEYCILSKGFAYYYDTDWLIQRWNNRVSIKENSIINIQEFQEKRKLII